MNAETKLKSMEFEALAKVRDDRYQYESEPAGVRHKRTLHVYWYKDQFDYLEMRTCEHCGAPDDYGQYREGAIEVLQELGWK